MDWPKFWDSLKGAPLWLFAGAGAVAWTLLYAPTLPGFDLTDVRKGLGGYIAAVAIGSTILFLAQGLSRVAGWAGKHMPKGRLSPLVLTIQEQANTAFWGETEQPDGSVVSNINLHLKAFNGADGLVRIASARLLKPRVSRDRVTQTLILVSDPKGGRLFSSDHPIHPRGISHLSIALYLSGRVGRPGKRLNVVLEVTDHAGLKARVRARLHPVL